MFQFWSKKRFAFLFPHSFSVCSFLIIFDHFWSFCIILKLFLFSSCYHLILLLSRRLFSWNLFFSHFLKKSFESNTWNIYLFSLSFLWFFFLSIFFHRMELNVPHYFTIISVFSLSYNKCFSTFFNNFFFFFTFSRLIKRSRLWFAKSKEQIDLIWIRMKRSGDSFEKPPEKLKFGLRSQKKWILSDVEIG